MGRWFETFFSDAGIPVLISDLDTELTPQDLAKQCEIVVISVPMDVAEKVAGEIGPMLGKDQLLTDFCSLKEDIVARMMDSTNAQVLGIHPLFGPFMDSIQGQNMIFCPGRGTTWPDRLRQVFESRGAIVRQMDSTDHDRNMAVFQGLTHILSICIGKTFQKMGMVPQEAIAYSTPVFRINADLVGRLFAQDLRLYANLIGKNKYVGEVLESFLSSLNEGQQHLLSDQDGGEITFLEGIRDYLGEFCQNGLEESNKFLNIFYSETAKPPES